MRKEYLDAELAKYDDWNHADKNTRVIFASNSQFQYCKQEGIVHGTILKFPGAEFEGVGKTLNPS